MTRESFVILAVDDETTMHRVFRSVLRDYEVLTAHSIREARQVLTSAYVRAVLLDLSLPDQGGLEFLPELASLAPEAEVIVVTSDNTAQSGVKALQLGARDYLVKPFDPSELRTRIDRLYEEDCRRRQIDNYRREDGLEGQLIVGEAPVMQRMIARIRATAAADAPVLIHGETGTGKELVARHVHGWSQRAQGPFVAVNCASIAPTLLESELFGHEKGSFTGAANRRLGRFELASGGTLFLDEICSLAREAQAKLLRVLETKLVTRVGGEMEIPVDFRLVAASNRPLQDMVRAGEFREDLFYRLNVVEIEVPPLRERREDIPLLFEYFVRRQAEQQGRTAPALSDDLCALLRGAEWRGNVRELQNVVQRMLIECAGDTLLPEHFARIRPADGAGAEAGYDGLPLEEAQKAFKRDYVLAAYNRNGQNVQRTATELGVHYSTVYRTLGLSNAIPFSATESSAG